MTRILLTVALLSLLSAPLPFAQTGLCQEQAAADTSAVAVRHLPEEAIASLSLWPSRSAALPRFRLAPLEIATAAGLEHVGIDPLKIKRIDVMAPMPGPSGPQFGATIQLDSPTKLNDLRPSVFRDDQERDEKGFKYRLFADQPPGMELVLHQPSPTVILFGTRLFVKRMAATRRNPSGLAATLTAARGQQDALALLGLSTLRPILEGGIESARREIPPPIAEHLNTIVNGTDLVALRLVLDQSEKLQLVASASDEDKAASVEKSLLQLIAMGRQMVIQGMKDSVPADDSPTNRATVQYIDRMTADVVAKFTPKRSGKRIVLEVEGIENTATIGTLVGLLLPAVQAAREAARRMESSNNLKQLGLALHNFESANKSFPSTAILDKQTGKPLLSWRVAVLPYIEQAGLYNEFHLDEPWDSPHNIQLLPRMPATYRHPSRNLAPGHTIYLAPVNDQTILRKDKPAKMREIIDGTSNTIMLVEAGDAAAVPWTAPDDLEIDLTDPLKNLLAPNMPIFQACFGDGSVHALSADIDLNMLRALFTRAGGEVINGGF